MSLVNDIHETTWKQRFGITPKDKAMLRIRRAEERVGRAVIAYLLDRSDKIAFRSECERADWISDMARKVDNSTETGLNVA